MPAGSAGGGGCCIGGRAGEPGMGGMPEAALYAPASGPPTGDDAMACGVLPRRTGRERSAGDGALPGGGGGGGAWPAPVGYCSIPPLLLRCCGCDGKRERDQTTPPTRLASSGPSSGGRRRGRQAPVL